MKRTGCVFLLATLLLIAPLSLSRASAPLRYHTHLVAVLEARVKDLRLAVIPSQGPPEPSRSPQSVGGTVQKIILQVLKVDKMELNLTGSLIKPGDCLEVTNQYLDQKPPFAVGETIKARVRLVLPEDRYNVKDPRRRWWFFPPGEPAGILPSRHPFAGIEIVR